jgi:hypothetical protein
MQYLIYSTIRSMQYLIYPTINLCYNLVITIIQIRPIAIGKMGPGVVHDWVSPMFGLSFGQFRLVEAYKLCRVRNSFEWSCPRHRTSYGVDLTRRFWVWWFEFYLWLCLIYLDGYCHPLIYYRCYIHSYY